VKLSRLLAGVLGVVMGVLPIMPPEHVHEAQEQGHVQAVVHRHLPDHGVFDHRADDHHPATVDHGDDPILTLSSVYNVAVPFVMVAPVLRVEARIAPPEPRRVARASTDVEILIHGPPPAPTGLRAPPAIPTT